MVSSQRKRIYIIAATVLLMAFVTGYVYWHWNHSVHYRLGQILGYLEVNPRKALEDIEQIDRRFLTEKNYMQHNLLKAGALVRTHEYVKSDSLLDFVLPYFKYRSDSLNLAEIYYYKGEIAHHSNFLLEAVEYFTLCSQHGSGTYDPRELNFYLNNFKGKVYHIKRMAEEEKQAKLIALTLARDLKNPQYMEEAYSELTHYYAGADNCDQNIPLLKNAVTQGYSGSLQTRLLFLLSEEYANRHQTDSAHIYARQIPSMYCDSIDYLMGKIYSNLQQTDSAHYYFERSVKGGNPAFCLKAYRQLLDINVRIGSIEGMSKCLVKLARCEEQLDSIDNKEALTQLENVEILRKSIRDSENAEVEYYIYWIIYFWVMVAAFVCIFALLLVSVILRKKKRDLQLKRQQARLDALKMQIDPHFVFNNLSILLDLVETNDRTAPAYIKALSKVYRHIVSNVDQNLSSVEEELSCLESYIFLLKIRFDNAIQVDIQVEGEIKERRMPPIVLQMLLENAIKHNQASEEMPLLIRVYSKGNKLVVENCKMPMVSSVSSRHIGLRNIRERYMLIGAPAPEMYEDEKVYRVVLETL